MKHYYIDCDYFDVEEEIWQGDLDFEEYIDETETESLEEAIQNVLYYFKSGQFEEDYGNNETFMFSIFEGVWNDELEMWEYDNCHDRQSKIVYRIFSGSKEFADRYDIKADIYMNYY